MNERLFDPDGPPDAVGVYTILANAHAVLAQANVRPDDFPTAHQAAAKVMVGRKEACLRVYAWLYAFHPEPVSGPRVVSRFLGEMRDPERRLRELRAALIEAGSLWAVNNVNGAWVIEQTGAGR